MINALHIKNDFRQIFKNPMMVLFFAIPVFIPVIFRLLLAFLIPYLQNFLVFDVEPYYGYILSATLTFAPISLGMVTGFMMLDERDGSIFELMRVTPLGSSGYLANRMVFCMSASFVYTFMIYLILDIYSLSFLSLLILSVLMSVLSLVISLCLFLLATDKVKGLTYAKGLNLFSLFALSDLLGIKWLSAVSHAVPTYWVTKIVFAPGNVLNYLLSFAVCLIWLGGVYRVYRRRMG